MGTVVSEQLKCKHINLNNMRSLVVVILIGSSMGVRKLKQPKEREEKSLLNTFPFNADGDEEHHEHEHEPHIEKQPSVQLVPVDANQRSGLDGVSFGDVAGASPGRDGKRCIDKVEMIEETEYDEVVQCDHSYDRRCHTSYVTNYESQQEEECEENFRKNCFINYEKITFNE